MVLVPVQGCSGVFPPGKEILFKKAKGTEVESFTPKVESFTPKNWGKKSEVIF